MTAHVMCGRFEIFELARHFGIEFESGGPIRIRSILEASQVPSQDCCYIYPVG